MATDCYTQLGVGFQPKLVVDCAGGTLTTEAGLLLVREFDEQRGLSSDVVSRITDARDARYITHDLERSSVSGCIRLRPGTKTLTTPTGSATIRRFRSSRPMGEPPLGSQPTLSRLENAIEWPAIQRLARTAVDWFCATPTGLTSIRPISSSISTARTIPTHGTQQLRCFMAGTTSKYFLLVWFEGCTGLLVRTRLRPGRDASATGVVDELRHILPPLRRRFPHTPIFLRGDAGMATPAVEAKLEAEDVRCPGHRHE